MKVAILCLNKHGADGRKPGLILHMREFKDDETVSWGPKTRQKPPNFFTVVIKDMRISDLPDSWKDFGGHYSRTTVDKTKWSAEEIAELERDEKKEMTFDSVKFKVTDDGGAGKPNLDIEIEGVG